jgi:hypothetical protein
MILVDGEELRSEKNSVAPLIINCLESHKNNLEEFVALLKRYVEIKNKLSFIFYKIVTGKILEKICGSRCSYMLL